MSTVLVIDDEEDILYLIEFNLGRSGYTVKTAKSAEEGYQIAKRERIDLIILDIMLPGMNGNELHTKLSLTPETANIPIIMLTACGEEADIINGLSKKKVKDYITKPFSVKVLLARVRNTLEDLPKSRELTYGGIKIDINKHAAYIDGKEIRLTLSEMNYLKLFMHSPGRVYTRNEIIDLTKGSDYPVETRSVDQTIRGLRIKLEDRANLIETVRGVGYRICIV